jgi:diguanylate cyclase (GGDEF)-like protein
MPLPAITGKGGIGTVVNPSLLASLPIFAGMSRLEREAIAELVREVRVGGGEVCLRAGKRSLGLFILAEGSVRGRLEAGRAGLSFDVGTGGCFGELSLLEDGPSQLTYVAASDAVLYVLDAIDFHAIVWEHPILGVKLLKAMIRASIVSLAGANRFLDDLVRLGEKARLRSISDPLTGLFNRRYLEETMDQFFGRARSRPCALIMIDLDRFREINAKIGESAADGILKSLGPLLRSAVPEGGVAARLSGDEFAIFLPDADPIEGAAVAEAFAQAVRTLPPLADGRGDGMRVTVSQGVAVCPDHATSASTLLKVADIALFRAKEMGKDRIERA